MKRLISVTLLPLALAACGKIESGNVGVRTTFTGEIIAQELGQGFYTAFTSDVSEFSTRENSIFLSDMQPKAKDNLSLQDLDVEVYYKASAASIAELTIKYAGQHYRKGGQASLLPAGALVYSFARDTIYDAVSKYESLEIHKNRDTLRTAVQEELQRALNVSDPGVFTITKVVIRNVQTDRSVEKAISDNVAAQKELERQITQVEIAKKHAQMNKILQQSLSPEILKQRELDTIREVCAVSQCILSIGSDNPRPVYQVGK